jgi:hypothetical protein
MEEEIIKVETNTNRPEIVWVPVYGRYESEAKGFLYNDSKQEYEMKSATLNNRSVTTIRAFAAIIKEELKRRKNPTGEKATVIIHSTGGDFVPDENFGDDIVRFKRLTSKQWNTIKYGINSTYDVPAFKKFIQVLAPCINNFDEVWEKLSEKKISIDEEIWLDVPYGKGTEKTYDIPLDCRIIRDDSGVLNIEVYCHTFEYIEEQAINDDAEYITSEIQEFTDLLILNDF